MAPRCLDAFLNGNVSAVLGTVSEIYITKVDEGRFCSGIRLLIPLDVLVRDAIVTGE